MKEGGCCPSRAPDQNPSPTEDRCQPSLPCPAEPPARIWMALQCLLASLRASEQQPLLPPCQPKGRLQRRTQGQMGRQDPLPPAGPSGAPPPRYTLKPHPSRGWAPRQGLCPGQDPSVINSPTLLAPRPPHPHRCANQPVASTCPVDCSHSLLLPERLPPSCL